MCLDVPGANQGDAVKVDIEPCNNSLQQLWWPWGITVELESAVTSGGQTMCLDMQGGVS